MSVHAAFDLVRDETIPEIASDVADGPRSVIREQVNNGVAVRMAVLAAIAATLTRHRRPL